MVQIHMKVKPVETSIRKKSNDLFSVQVFAPNVLLALQFSTNTPPVHG